jgi:antirestriction protein ArdC
MASSVYETITNRIIDSLEAGVIPWRKEWKTAGKSSGLPYNLVTKAAYRGVNVLTLLCSPYASTGWCTYKQAQTLGYQVRKGEKSSPVVFWKFPSKAELLADPEAKPWARCYSVFNVEQLDGVPVAAPADDALPFDSIAECETVVGAFMAAASHPTLAHGGDRACYRQITDHVQMPVRESFSSPAAYYATLFHEFAHSTGIKVRLNRSEFEGMGAFGDVPYSREELTAEFASAFLCGETGTANDERIANSVAYIQHWIKVLKNDKALAIQAAQKAQKAADYILGRTFAAREDEEVAQ